MPAWRLSTASSSDSRIGSSPTHRRRGEPPGDWSTRAWISTSSGRVPSWVMSTQEPATESACCDRNRAEGLLTVFRPRSVMPKTPSSLTAPKRFLIARIRRKVEWLSPSKYSTVSTMCSSTRGPASAPSLVTWPIITTAMPCCLARRVSCAAQSRTCETEPGADCSSSLITVWIESTTTTAGLTVPMAAMMRSSEISASIGRREPSIPSRLPRNATWASDSSPLT